MPLMNARADSIVGMKAPKGSQRIDYIAIFVHPEVSVRDIWSFVAQSSLILWNNGKWAGTASILFLPMEPPMSGRFVWKFNYGHVQEGDELIVEMVNQDEVPLPCGFRFDCELSILGKVDADQIDASMMPTHGLLRLEEDS